MISRRTRVTINGMLTVVQNPQPKLVDHDKSRGRLRVRIFSVMPSTFTHDLFPISAGSVLGSPVVELLQGPSHMERWRVEQVIFDQPPVSGLVDDLVKLGNVPEILRQRMSWSPLMAPLAIPRLHLHLMAAPRAVRIEDLVSGDIGQPALVADSAGPSQSVPVLLTRLGHLDELTHSLQALLDFPVEERHLGSIVLASGTRLVGEYRQDVRLTKRATSLRGLPLSSLRSLESGSGAEGTTEQRGPIWRACAGRLWPPRCWLLQSSFLRRRCELCLRVRTLLPSNSTLSSL